jgi:ABC-type lipoprotein release transport system permease subunit
LIQAALGEFGVRFSFVAGIVALLALVSIVASLIPVHRASRIHPSQVL